jgi:citrate synthase
MTDKEKSLLSGYTEKAETNNRIDATYYERFDVKRGLRNSDGTGVLVGVTNIGNVHGYILDEKEKVPVPGQLFYRGFDLADLVTGFQQDGRFGFEEITYLLIFGELPNAAELEEFASYLGSRRKLPQHFTEDMILKAPSSNIMNKLARSVLACYSYDPDSDDLSLTNCLRQCLQLIAWFPVMVAYGYQAKRRYHDGMSLFIHTPDPQLSTAENFLTMIRADRQYTPLEAEILDLCLVIHAEHGGGNNSTFSIHVISSTETDCYSTVSAAVGSLKGSKHGGANIKVWQMMTDLKSHVSHWENEGKIVDYLKKILQKKAFDRTGLIYGMGHAVYTLSDPRAELLRSKAEFLAKEKGREEEFALLQRVARLVPELFRETKNSEKALAPNVDYYSGFVYDMLDIPTALFTPIFAISRIAGWCAHLIEERVSGGKIVRPAYKNVVDRNEYTPLPQRN